MATILRIAVANHKAALDSINKNGLKRGSGGIGTSGSLPGSSGFFFSSFSRYILRAATGIEKSSPRSVPSVSSSLEKIFTIS